LLRFVRTHLLLGSTPSRVRAATAAGAQTRSHNRWQLAQADDVSFVDSERTASGAVERHRSGGNACSRGRHPKSFKVAEQGLATGKAVPLPLPLESAFSGLSAVHPRNETEPVLSAVDVIQLDVCLQTRLCPIRASQPSEVEMNTNYETLKVEIDAAHIVTITMNRPEVLNAMNMRMTQEMHDCFTGFHVDQDTATCLILTGSGERGFCTGADLKERKGMEDHIWFRQLLWSARFL
jgi:hypothetical protein